MYVCQRLHRELVGDGIKPKRLLDRERSCAGTAYTARRTATWKLVAVVRSIK
jgi:hypothetical protein